MEFIKINLLFLWIYVEGFFLCIPWLPHTINVDTGTKNKNSLKTTTIYIQYHILKKYRFTTPWRTNYNLWKWYSWCYIVFWLLEIILCCFVRFYYWNIIPMLLKYIRNYNILYFVDGTSDNRKGHHPLIRS